jgi:hypothetical protein
MFNEDTPFGTWGGYPINGGPGISSSFSSYVNEKDLLHLIPQLRPEQQVMLDIKLNMSGIDNFPDSSHLLVDNSEKKKGLIPIFQGKVRNPSIIKSFIPVVQQSKLTHQKRAANQLTGSHAWNDMWIKVYDHWLEIIHNLLGELDGTKTDRQ